MQTRPIIVAFLAVIVFAFVARAAEVNAPPTSDAFANAVDLSKFERLTIQHQQTLKCFDTYARQLLTRIAGKSTMDGRPATFTVLDIAFRPDAYHDRDLIKISHLPVRQELREALVRDNIIDAKEGDRLLKTGLVSPHFWEKPEVLNTLRRLIADDNRRTEAVAQADSAARTLSDLSRGGFMIFDMLPPTPGDANRQWLSLGELTRRIRESESTGAAAGQPLKGIDLPSLQRVADAFDKLSKAWANQNASEANAQIEALAAALPAMNPDRYPSDALRGMEVAYNRMAKLTLPGAAFYFVAFTCFLLSVRSGSPSMRLWALRTFVIGYAIHTAGIAIRWWLVAAQHDSWFDGIPIKNQFESVLFSAWFGCTIGLLLEMRKSRGLFGAAASFVGWLSLVAIFAAPHVFGRDIGGEIGQVSGVLMSYWLYIHVTVVTASYALIGMSFALGLWWLIKYYLSERQLERASGYQISADAADSPLLAGAGGAAALSTGILRTLALMLFMPAARPEAASAKVVAEDVKARSLLATIDACNLVILQLAFWLLGLGIVLGAVWADESWGRPWGWDPKETFALVTWIVYLIIVHVRFATEHKAWWTAVLAILGFFVMLFNWIGVNFFLVGLHSYA